MKKAYISIHRMTMYALPLALAILSGCAGEASVDTSASEVHTDTADAKLKTLKASVEGAQIERLTDYGHNVALTDYAKGTSLEKIIGDVTSTDEGDVALTSFSKSEGDRAVEDFAKALEGASHDILENAEDEDDKKAAAALTKVATDARAFFLPATQFDSIVTREHGIQEDGDLESHTLVATKHDGSIVVLSYTNFPF